jgi:hypothetical protein
MCDNLFILSNNLQRLKRQESKLGENEQGFRGSIILLN